MSEKMTDKQIVDWVLSCRNEAEEAKTDRMSRNKENFDMFHLKYDFSHKEEGQSTDVLSKQPMAVEQIKSFFQQALADLGEWWKAEATYAQAEDSMKIKPSEITKLTNYMLMKARYFAHVGNTIQSALLGSLAISKTYGRVVPKPKFVARKKGRGKDLKRWVEKIEDKTWELRFDVVRQENFYPDPSGKGLYVIEDMWPDMHEIYALAEGDNAIYDKAVVNQLSVAGTDDAEESAGKSRETGQNTTLSGHRPKAKITEFWGTVINPTSGEIEMENCVITIANDSHLLRKDPNPNWNQRNPYNYSPLMEVANSVWHKAPMDAPTQHAKSCTEMHNLLVDAAFKQVHAISQIRSDALKDPGQISDGIKPGATLDVNMTLAQGMKVLEPLTSVIVPAEALNIFNIMSQEFNASALTNDLRQGVMPFRAVKATEVVEASQTITSVFQGMAKNYESRQSMPELELAWQTTAQNWDLISKEEFIALFGEQRGTEMSQMSAEEVFASTINGVKFQVYGITLTLSKANDFRKITTLMQTLFANPPMMEEFLKKYSLAGLVGEIMTTLDINKSKLEIPAAEQATMMEQPEEAAPQGGPDMMSQVPQAGAGSLADIFAGGMPQSSFPGGPASGGAQ